MQKLVSQAKNKREPSLALLKELDEIDKNYPLFSYPSFKPFFAKGYSRSV